MESPRAPCSEKVAGEAAHQAKDYLKTDAPVGRPAHGPIALAGSGRFCTVPLSRHGRTNMQVIQMFLPIGFKVEEEEGRVATVEVVSSGAS